MIDRRFWAGRRVLVTGHTGFKGAWLALWLEQLRAHVSAFALPPAPGPGAYATLGPWDALHERDLDLRDAEGVASFVAEAQPEVVLHLAAEAVVRRAHADPVATFETNVIGTANLLEALRDTGTVRVAVVVTSDKVYAEPGERPAREGDRLGHHDPYSSSKACQEQVVAAWRETYLADAGVALATARAGNVIGGGDTAPDRLVPDVLRAHTRGATVEIRNPDAVRPWQHVLEPLHGYLLLAQHLALTPPPHVHTLNLGPTEPGWPVAAVVQHLQAILGAGSYRVVSDRSVPEAATLLLDSSLAKETLGWRPVLDVEQGLDWTAAWHVARDTGTPMRPFGQQQITAYEGLLAAQSEAG